MILQDLAAYHQLAALAFGRWDDVLAAPLPDASLRYARGLAEYARGVAAARLGRATDARASLDSVRAVRSVIEGEPFTSVMGIAEHTLQGELAAAAGDRAGAVAHLEAAAALEDGLGYMEPPFWHKPVRHMLGAALLRADRAADAERVYREDLARFPNNGWALRGLASALERQGRVEEAERTRAALAVAWAAADVEPAGSTF